MAVETAISRLILSALLGGLVGLERESLNRPAGFRTHILVSIGSTLIMLVSLDVFRLFGEMTNADPGRIAAQVVSGIGFLGAGTILRDGATIRGLTTAASLWLVAGVGLAVGIGAYVPAVASTVIGLAALTFLSRLERLVIVRRQFQEIVVTVDDHPGQLGKIGSVLGKHEVNIRNVEMRSGRKGKIVQIVLSVRLPSNANLARITDDLFNIEGVQSVETE